MLSQLLPTRCKVTRGRGKAEQITLFEGTQSPVPQFPRCACAQQGCVSGCGRRDGAGERRSKSGAGEGTGQCRRPLPFIWEAPDGSAPLRGVRIKTVSAFGALHEPRVRCFFDGLEAVFCATQSYERYCHIFRH